MGRKARSGLVRDPRGVYIPRRFDHAGKRHGLPVLCGEVAEWLKVPHSKCGVLARVPWVRIPPSPPLKKAPIPGAFFNGGRSGGKNPCSTKRQRRFGASGPAARSAGRQAKDENRPKPVFANPTRSIFRTILQCDTPQSPIMYTKAHLRNLRARLKIIVEWFQRLVIHRICKNHGGSNGLDRNHSGAA